MAGVGRAAAEGQLPDAATMEDLRQLARVAPLNPQPYLVAAAIAQKQGDTGRAEKLLVEARRLHPRSAAARYLLADLYLRDGRVADGLAELASLARLIRGSAVELVPALAEYAKSPGAAEELDRVLEANPRLRQPVLGALAADPANAPLILRLEGNRRQSADGRLPPWQGRLLQAMVAQGSYDAAYSLWRQLSGVGEGERPLLFNGEFRRLSSPPPFNWTFASSSGGFAEPGDGSMEVLHYGRENMTLASQLLVLEPGRYRFEAAVTGNPGEGSLAWAVTCHRGRALGERDLRDSRPFVFEVPADCPAQSLELRGRLQDMPQESDVRVGPARIERVAQ